MIYNFTLDFFSKREVYPFFHYIRNKTNKQDYYNPLETADCELHNKVYVVNHIPPYLEALTYQGPKALTCFKIYQMKGYLADLKGFDSLEDYMKKQFGPKSRSKMRGYLRRLEKCFDIRYSWYYGEIEKQEYDWLFRQLHHLIARRFIQRGDTHESFAHWQTLEEITYEMILQKQASIFVIYDGPKAIDICINYHHQNILDNSIRSYDIDYSKFRLGYVDIMKQLEWCIANHYRIFDLSYGVFDYKKWWCNQEYLFEQQILYRKNDIFKKGQAFCIMQLLRLKGYLKEKNVHLLYHKIRKQFKKSGLPEVKAEKKPLQLKESPWTDDIDVTAWQTLDIEKDDFGFLRKTVYDFQYRNAEHRSCIRIYQTEMEPDCYIISGTKNKTMVRAESKNSIETRKA